MPSLNGWPLRWTEVLDRATALGGRRMLFLGLALAERLLYTPLPHHVRMAIDADHALDGLVRDVSAALFSETSGHEPQRAHVRFHLRTRERLRDRCRYLFLYIVSPSYSDWKTISLPRWLFPLYYVIRPFRLSAKLLSTAVCLSPTPERTKKGPA